MHPYVKVESSGGKQKEKTEDNKGSLSLAAQRGDDLGAVSIRLAFGKAPGLINFLQFGLRVTNIQTRFLYR